MYNKYNFPKFVNIIYNILLLGENQIIRDYKELEYLQSNRKPPYNYANKLREIISKKILYEIENLLPQFGVIFNRKIIKKTVKNNYIVLNLLTEEQNLLRSLPFITCNAAIANIPNIQTPITATTSAAIVLNPILNLFYWTGETGHSFEQNQSLKPSQSQDLNELYSTPLHIRLNSPSLELCFLASGKIDSITTNFNDYLEIIPALHIAKNAGIAYNIDGKNIIAAATAELLKKLTNEKN